MKARIIKNEIDYAASLARIDLLMDDDPDPSTDAGAELELLTMLVGQYEDEKFPIDLPSPVGAIKFRMEQAGLKQSDLTPYIGSKGKVSEVLNGKRPLSLKMIRKLHAGLGIPAEVLLQDAAKTALEPAYRVSAFPMAELLKRGYLNFSGTVQEAKEYGEELIETLFQVFEGSPPSPVYCRRAAKDINEHALLAWQAKALHEAKRASLPAFDLNAVGADFAAMLAKLSYSSKGPQTAVEFLNKKGVHVIFLKHLPKTYLDGASFLSVSGNPVIAMTLRYDRLDNFWFTLLHELGHVHLHLHDTSQAFFDDTDKLSETHDPTEQEANQYAASALIPDSEWAKSAHHLLTRPSASKTLRFAEQISIHPSVVAGRIRWERNNYRLLPELSYNRTLNKMLHPNP
jgi:HTH-type transcriptional regulator/antitoxin HigA